MITCEVYKKVSECYIVRLKHCFNINLRLLGTEMKINGSSTKKIFGRHFRYCYLVVKIKEITIIVSDLVVHLQDFLQKQNTLPP